MLPEHVNIILLSATVPNTKEFADWVGCVSVILTTPLTIRRTKKKDIYVISTPKRPVPLEHFLWAGRELHRIVDSRGVFIPSGYACLPCSTRLTISYVLAADSLRRKQDKEREAAGLPPVVRTGGRGAAPTRARDLPTGRNAPFSNIGAGRHHSNRGGGGNGSGPPPTRGGGANGTGPPATRGGFRGRGGFGAARPSFQLDQNVWVHLINHLKKSNLLPVVNFVFSKKRCEEYAGTLTSMDLCSAIEKSEVHITWEKALNRLKGRLVSATEGLC